MAPTRNSSERTFYRTRLTRFLLYPFCVAGFVFTFPLVVAPRGGWPVHVIALVAMLAWALSFKVPGRFGLTIGNRGVVVCHGLWSRSIDWGQIDSFDTRRWGFNQEVGIQLKDGRRALTSLLQGRVVTWRDGATRDIMSILAAAQRDWQQKRSVQAPTPAKLSSLS